MLTQTESNLGKCTAQELRMLRFPDVMNKTGLSKSAIYGRIRSHEFPAPIPLGPRAVGFVAHEVDAWLRGLIADARRTAGSGVH